MSRRSFLKAAVAIGGATGLSACVSMDGEVEVPRGPADLSTHPERQHAWNAVLATDDAGNDVAPRHHVLLSLGLPDGGTPTESMRETAETAFRSIERAYERSHEGLLFTVGYSHAYFARYHTQLPRLVDLPRPHAIGSLEDPELDEPDMMVHLASDHPQVVLRAEQALRGENDSVNGVSIDAALTGALDVTDRRTGFIGAGLPAEHEDATGLPEGTIDEDAPLFMGFKSGFTGNQAPEDRVTIEAGPFAGGTTQHVSQINVNLDQWYTQDGREERVAKMFCPGHAREGLVEGTGENLGQSSKVTGCKPPMESAREDGVVGHSQKLVDVRENGMPIILRRDFDTTDGDRPGVHFVSLHRSIADFITTRTAMNGELLAMETPVGTRNNNGILQYLDVVRRGYFLVPPRAHRSLPTPNPEAEA